MSHHAILFSPKLFVYYSSYRHCLLVSEVLTINSWRPPDVVRPQLLGLVFFGVSLTSCVCHLVAVSGGSETRTHHMGAITEVAGTMARTHYGWSQKVNEAVLLGYCFLCRTRRPSTLLVLNRFPGPRGTSVLLPVFFGDPRFILRPRVAD